MLLKRHSQITIQMRRVNHDDRMRVFRHHLNECVDLKRVVINAEKYLSNHQEKVMG